MAKICIVLATYNGEKYLPEMLNSLIYQERAANVIIAVDDGSTDSTLSILEKYKDKLPLQIFASKENHGHRAAFSKGLELAKEQLLSDDLIALADQDDIWLPEKIKILEKEIGKNALVFGDAEIINGYGFTTAPSWRAYSSIDTKCSMMQQIAGINNVTGCLCLFKVSLLDKILPIPENVTVHDRWLAMFAMRNGGIKAIPQTVAKYRIHGENAVGGAKQASMSKTLEVQEKWVEEILRHAENLNLTPDEISFAQKLKKASKLRQTKWFIPSLLPFAFKNRKNLFLKAHFIVTLKRIAFTTVGLPLAKKLFRKD